MLHVLAAMLTERRIIFSSKNLGRLSCCVQAANTLIYPMVWQQLFIPVLPIQLIDYLQAPMPFLIGVPDPVLKTVRTSDLGEVVIINIDDNTVKTPFDDLAQMPQEVVDQLKKSLKNRPSLLGDGVARAFLRAIVQLTKGYRDAMEFREKIVFNGDLFVESRPQSYRPFIRSMLRLQTFQQVRDKKNIYFNNISYCVILIPSIFFLSLLRIVYICSIQEHHHQMSLKMSWPLAQSMQIIGSNSNIRNGPDR